MSKNIIDLLDMSKSTDEKLKEFMEDMAKMIDAKLVAFQKGIEAKIAPPVSIPLPQPQPGVIIGPIQNCQLDVIANGGNIANRPDFVRELGPLMVKYGIMELTAKIRQQ